MSELIEKTRQEEIRDKGFNMGNVEFGSMKIGKKLLEDAVFDLGTLKNQNKKFADKNKIIKALADCDIVTLREISNYFYRTSGIYFRMCNYFAQMYRYDWYLTTEIYDNKIKNKPEKIVAETNRVLNFLDNSYIKKNCGDIALSVIKNGAYYGIVVPSKNGIILQELPATYCRSRYSVGNMPAVELNMQFFDANFSDVVQRMKILKMFPEDVQKGYVLYKQGKIPSDSSNASGSPWYLLNPGSAIKFDFGNGDVPLFANAIPTLLDLDAAQDLDRRKQMQKLLKIIVQKLPLDKNGDLIFDIDEARDIHNNAVQMLAHAIGIDVLTTFTDVDEIAVSDQNTTTTNDDLEKIERQVYNAFGTAQNLFNSDGNLATTNSILNDEGICRTLKLQFEAFYDQVAQALSGNNKKYKFRFWMLDTTQYNYERLAKLYKEQVTLGYPRLLPQIALGHSQSFIINACVFENEILNLNDIMIPPMSSNTMSSSNLDKTNNSNSSKNQNKIEGEDKDAGRPEKDDAEKSDKTIANKESMN